MDKLRYNVVGMTCGHCADAVTRELTGVAGVRSVDVSVENGTVFVDGDGVDDAAVRAAIDEAGYAVA